MALDLLFVGLDSSVFSLLVPLDEQIGHPLLGRLETIMTLAVAITC